MASKFKYLFDPLKTIVTYTVVIFMGSLSKPSTHCLAVPKFGDIHRYSPKIMEKLIVLEMPDTAKIDRNTFKEVESRILDILSNIFGSTAMTNPIVPNSDTNLYQILCASFDRTQNGIVADFFSDIWIE